MSKFNENSIMPPSVDVVFRLRDHTIQTYPLFLFLLLARQFNPQVSDSDLYNDLSVASDKIAGQSKQDHYIQFITEIVPWKDFAPFVVASIDTYDAIKKTWMAKGGEGSPFRINFQRKKLPKILYRYLPFRDDRIESLLCGPGVQEE